MHPFYQPVLVALFVWWFVTGLIFVAYGRSQSSFTRFRYALKASIYHELLILSYLALLVLPLPATLWGWGIRTLPESASLPTELHPKSQPPPVVWLKPPR